MSRKVAQNDFTGKLIDFNTFTKIAYECGRFGQINYCQRLQKVAQSAKNRPIWSPQLRERGFVGVSEREAISSYVVREAA